MSTADKLASYVLPTYAQFAVAPVRGQGTILWDGQGTRYLDFCSGLATCTRSEERRVGKECER